jgi:hypothetical protein
VLSWKDLEMNIWEPYVVWDDDPDKRPRPMYADNLEVIEIQSGCSRYIPPHGSSMNLLTKDALHPASLSFIETPPFFSAELAILKYVYTPVDEKAEVSVSP